MKRFFLLLIAIIGAQAIGLAQVPGIDKLAFEVQIGLFSEQAAPDSFDLPGYVKERTTAEGTFQYTCGEFTNYRAAADLKKALKQFGVEDAFIVSFIEGEQSSMDEAALYLDRFYESMIAVEQ